MQFIIHENPKILHLTQFLQCPNKKLVSSDIACLFEISIQPDLLVEMGSCQSFAPQGNSVQWILKYHISTVSIGAGHVGFQVVCVEFRFKFWR